MFAVCKHLLKNKEINESYKIQSFSVEQKHKVEFFLSGKR